MKAFVLGAGLGTRLRRLTDWLPKPMIPVYHRPLITYAFDHLLENGASEFIVNTHHCPAVYDDAFPQRHYRGAPLAFRHEPVLLETAGGLANIADLLGDDERLFVYNGDILADMPLGPLLRRHEAAGHEVTLLLRSHGPGLHIGLGGLDQNVLDIRSMLGTAGIERWCQFTGIYLVEPAFRRRLSPGKKESVIPHFLQMIREGDDTLGACVIDEGHWWDLGDEATYRGVHEEVLAGDFPRYDEFFRLSPAVHPTASIDDDVQLAGTCVIGPYARIGVGARLTNVIVWPGAEVAAGAMLSDTVVRGNYAQHRTYFANRDDFAAR